MRALHNCVVSEGMLAFAPLSGLRELAKQAFTIVAVNVSDRIAKQILLTILRREVAPMKLPTYCNIMLVTWRDLEQVRKLVLFTAVT